MIKDLVVGVIGKQDALCHHVTKAGTREAAQQVLLAVLGDRGCGGFFGLGCRVVNLWQVQSNVDLHRSPGQMQEQRLDRFDLILLGDDVSRPKLHIQHVNNLFPGSGRS